MRPAYKYPAVALLALVVFIVSLFIIIPSGLVESIVRKAFEENAGLSFTAESFNRGFPLGFKAGRVRLTGKEVKDAKDDLSSGEIVEMEELRVTLAVLPLIIGKKRLSYAARLGGGTMEGEADIDENAGVDLSWKGVGINAIGPLSAMGIKTGSVSGEALFELTHESCPKGSVSLDATGVDVRELNSPWPAMLFGESVSASLALESRTDCVVEIKGLFIEGRALNARVAGVMRVKNPIKKSALDMKVEIFVRPGAPGREANEALLSLMKGYKRSSGYYLLSLKGTIGSPVIKR